MPRNTELIFQLKELLAIIHGDGGHHTEKVGKVQSIKDAIDKVNKLRQKLAENNLL